MGISSNANSTSETGPNPAHINISYETLPSEIVFQSARGGCMCSLGLVRQWGTNVPVYLHSGVSPQGFFRDHYQASDSKLRSSDNKKIHCLLNLLYFIMSSHTQKYSLEQAWHLTAVTKNIQALLYVWCSHSYPWVEVSL